MSSRKLLRNKRSYVPLCSYEGCLCFSLKHQSLRITLLTQTRVSGWFIIQINRLPFPLPFELFIFVPELAFSGTKTLWATEVSRLKEICLQVILWANMLPYGLQNARTILTRSLYMWTFKKPYHKYLAISCYILIKRCIICYRLARIQPNVCEQKPPYSNIKNFIQSYDNNNKWKHDFSHIIPYILICIASLSDLCMYKLMPLDGTHVLNYVILQYTFSLLWVFTNIYKEYSQDKLFKLQFTHTHTFMRHKCLKIIA